MWRGVAACPVPSGPEGGLDHGRDRPLAVGAGDVDRAKRPLGVVQALAERRHGLEPEFDPELFEAEEVGKRVARHATGAAEASGEAATSACAPMKRSARARAGLSSRRSTMRSSIPRSRRNSLR